MTALPAHRPIAGVHERTMKPLRLVPPPQEETPVLTKPKPTPKPKPKARNILPPPPPPPAPPPTSPPWHAEPPYSVTRPVRMADIITVVCGFIPEIQPEDILGPGRNFRIVFAREMIVVAARACTCRSYPEIARAIGRPNHSSVITMFQRVERKKRAGEKVDDRILADTTYEQAVSEVVELVKLTRRSR